MSTTNYINNTLGDATIGSITFTPTTSGIVGVTDGSSASSGIVGEVISSTISTGSGISLTDSVPSNITTISLTAGDWLVWGSTGYTSSGVALTTGIGWISETSAPTVPDFSLQNGITGSVSTFTTVVQAVAPQVFNVTTTTTLYLVGSANFASGTVNSYGSITALRFR